MVASRILLFANKAWEADALVAVLKSSKARPPRFPDAAAAPTVSVPLNGSGSHDVSARMKFDGRSGSLEFWCIQDLMDAAVSSSSSAEKARVLPYVASAGPAPDLVIAFGTAASPWTDSCNGCVVLGANLFVHDPFAASPNPRSDWTDSRFDQLVAAPPPPALSAVAGDLRPAIESRLLRVPLNPAREAVVISGASYVGLSSVNVTNYADYSWVDPQGLAAIRNAEIKQPVGSVETTHGVIRLVVPSRDFFFISGITDRSGFFDMEVAPRDYAQNFVAAHNAGIAAAWMMPLLIA
jgi:hypothetical protein